MEQRRRKRAENWSAEEKEILRQLVAQSAQILEDKRATTTTIKKKAQEWRNLTNIMNELTGKKREQIELRLAWKRMKLAAKARLSAQKQNQIKLGVDLKPKSILEESLTFVELEEEVPGSSTQVEPEILHAQPSHTPINVFINQDGEILNESTAPRQTQNDCKKRGFETMKKALQERILKKIHCNTQFKKRELEMLEVEHRLNVKIAELKIKKLELEIELIQNKKNTNGSD